MTERSKQRKLRRKIVRQQPRFRQRMKVMRRIDRMQRRVPAAEKLQPLWMSRARRVADNLRDAKLPEESQVSKPMPNQRSQL